MTDGILVTSQITVSLVILIASATLVRNGLTLNKIDLGLETHGVVSVNQPGRSRSLIPRTATVLATRAFSTRTTGNASRRHSTRPWV